MGISAADREALKHSVQHLVTVLRKRAGRRGTRLSRLMAELEAVGPGRHLLDVLDELGDVLARRTDELSLSVGTHRDVLKGVRPLNRGAAQWLTAFFATAEGPDISNAVVLNLEQLAASFLLESHHVVEARVRQFYPELQRAYPVGPGDGDRPGQMAMITIAIPAEVHRGARYHNLEGRRTGLAELRQSLPERDKNLTTLLMEAFPNDMLDPTKQGLPFAAFLNLLSVFYKEEFPELYTPTTLPTTGAGGIRRALLRIAADTGVPPGLIVP